MDSGVLGTHSLPKELEQSTMMKSQRMSEASVVHHSRSKPPSLGLYENPKPGTTSKAKIRVRGTLGMTNISEAIHGTTMESLVNCVSASQTMVPMDSAAPGHHKWGVPRLRGTLLGVPMIWIMVFVGLCWSPPYFGKLPTLF